MTDVLRHRADQGNTVQWRGHESCTYLLLMLIWSPKLTEQTRAYNESATADAQIANIPAPAA